MSQENVEIVRAAIEARNAGDVDGVRALLNTNTTAQMPDPWSPFERFFLGREVPPRWDPAHEVWFRDALEPASDFVHIFSSVVVRLIWWPAARREREQFTAVYAIREGKICREEFFWDHGEALARFGLSEQDGHADS